MYAMGSPGSLVVSRNRNTVCGWVFLHFSGKKNSWTKSGSDSHFCNALQDPVQTLPSIPNPTKDQEKWMADRILPPITSAVSFLQLF